ncbi:MAG: hypothetical protein AAFX08_11720 [Pseudomonadota bacterium]
MRAGAVEKKFGLPPISEEDGVLHSNHHHKKTPTDYETSLGVLDLALPLRQPRNFPIIEPSLEALRDAPVRRFASKKVRSRFQSLRLRGLSDGARRERRLMSAVLDTPQRHC